MKRAHPLDRALLHGLHRRLCDNTEPIDHTVLSAAIRMAQGYANRDPQPDDAAASIIEDFDEDALALIDILTIAALRLDSRIPAVDSRFG